MFFEITRTLCHQEILRTIVIVNWPDNLPFLFAGKFEYRVTEESLMDRLTTDNLAACLGIHQDCR